MRRCSAPLSLTALRTALRRVVSAETKTIRPPPHVVDQIIPADDPVMVADEMDKEVENLRFEPDGLNAAAQFSPFDI